MFEKFTVLLLVHSICPHNFYLFCGLIIRSGPFNRHHHLTQRWVIKHPVDFNSTLQDIVSLNPSSPSALLILQINGPFSPEKTSPSFVPGLWPRFWLQKSNRATSVSFHLPLFLPAFPPPEAHFLANDFVFACFQSNTQASHRYLMCHLHFREYHLCVQPESRAFLSASGIYRSSGGLGRAKHKGKQNSICEMG